MLRETFKKINPSKDVKILFFSGGHKLRDLGDEKKHMVDTFLTEHIKPGSNILVSSQYAHSGKTLNLIGESLEKLGFSHIDVSVMCDNGGWAEIDKDIFDDVFIGEIENHDQLELNEHSHVISGIIKSREYQVVPMRLDKYIDQGGGRDAVITSTEYASFFDPNEYDTIQERRIKSKDESNIKNYEDSMKIKLLPEEKTQIQENIKIARQEIHKVVDKIIHEL